MFKQIRSLPNEYVQSYLALRNAAVVLRWVQDHGGNPCLFIVSLTQLISSNKWFSKIPIWMMTGCVIHCRCELHINYILITYYVYRVINTSWSSFLCHLWYKFFYLYCDGYLSWWYFLRLNLHVHGWKKKMFQISYMFQLSLIFPSSV